MVEVEVLLAELQRLKAEKLTGAIVALSFVKRVTQPIQERVHPGYEFLGREDPTRRQNRKVSRSEAHRWVTLIVSGEVCDKGCPKAYCLKLPTTEMGNKKQANKGKKDDSPTGDWERTFLGIEPHFDLFHYFFHLRQQPSEDRQYLVCGAGIQFKQGKGKEYIYYSLPTNHSGWRSLWFYIGNHSPTLPERTPGKAVWRGEWNEKLNPNQMLQVTKLLKLIKEQKDMGVTGVSVMASMYKRRIMPLQKRCRFGFEYLGSNDPSRLTAEVLPSQMALDHVHRVLLDANMVPYVPKLFSAANPPKCAFQKLKSSRFDSDPLTDEELTDSDDDVPPAALLKKSGKESSSSLEVPSHSTKPRAVVRKRKLVLGGALDDNPSPPNSSVAKRSKDGGKAGSVGDDAAPETNIQPGAADPLAVDVSPSPSNSIPTSASQTPPKEPAGGSGKATTRGPRLIGLKKMVTKRSSTLNIFILSNPSSALSLEEPEDVPEAQAPEQGKGLDVAALETGAPSPPPPSPPATVTKVEIETTPEGGGAERVEEDPLASEIPEGELIVPPLPPGTILPEATLATAGGVAGALPEGSGTRDVHAVGTSAPGTSTAEAAGTTGPSAGDVGAASTFEPGVNAAEKEDMLVTRRECTPSPEKRKQIQGVFKDLYKFTTKELEDFKSAAQAVVEMVDFSTEASSNSQKVTIYIAEGTRTYIAQTLAMVKSYWPKAQLEPLGEGMAADCSVEQFTKFREEVVPIADKIAESLEQEG
ncbi:putative gypsy-type retrotransposon [Panicum miliaceum]|uniref:Gypsy-type retrotransposon n=1 Tax=Panicum miliaceum TaxID=4540 RepID=A0A3L6Q1V0_PANMI|nr:putative gypsy-type retrotransposon [Panicum miliaceum]